MEPNSSVGSRLDAAVSAELLTPARYKEMNKNSDAGTGGVVLKTLGAPIPTPKRPSRVDRLHLSVNGGGEPSAPPIYAQEEYRVKKPSRRRRASLSVIKMGAPTTPFAAKQRHSKTTDAMICSSDSCIPQDAVYTRTSFVGEKSVSFGNGKAYLVQLHIYDLSKGLLEKHSMETLGTQYPGVYHSAIVVYGMEFYFEGGIGYGREGKTRFGNVYKTVTLGSTERTLPQFIDWVQEKERTTKQLPDYHPIRHNCHHFSSEAAEFLMNCENPLPAYLFNTVKEIVREDLGAAVLEVLLMTTHGIQHSVARLLKSRVMERLNSLDMLVNSTTACGVHTLPPTACVLFRQDSKTKTNETIMSIDPFVTLLINEGYLKEKAKAVLHDCAFQVSHMFDTIDPDVVTGYMDIVNLSLSYTPPTLWGTIFNSFRICVLQKQFSIVLVFHESLIAQLLSAARDFPRLLPSARLSFLRLLCNLASSTHGAALLGDVRYAPTWVSVVGLGLMDCKHTAILYTAACLAVNLANVIVINTSPSLKREMSFLGDRHSCTQLATIVLYNLKYRPADVFPEPVFNMLLMAIYRIMSSNTKALEVVCFHSFKLNYDDLLKRCRTSESRALLCLMKTIEDLYA